MVKRNKKERQQLLIETIEKNPFITDEDLATSFGVSIQTVRLDRLELGIKELRERIKGVAVQNLEEHVRSLSIEEVIGEVIHLEPDCSGISLFDVKNEHVFSRNEIARGHYLFAQANSLAVAILKSDLVLTTQANVSFKRQVKIGERVVAKAKVEGIHTVEDRTIVDVNSYVGEELVFTGQFEMYRSNN